MKIREIHSDLLESALTVDPTSELSRAIASYRFRDLEAANAPFKYTALFSFAQTSPFLKVTNNRRRIAVLVGGRVVDVISATKLLLYTPIFSP